MITPRSKRITATSLTSPWQRAARSGTNVSGVIRAIQQKRNLFQPENGAHVERFLKQQGWTQLHNNGSSGTDYNNSLPIALLQLTTREYSQSKWLMAQVNKYRQRLVLQGWQGHAHGFFLDGNILFKPAGAAAALVEMLNQDLLDRFRHPIRVISHSFIAEKESQAILGSFEANAREIHILNIGNHFSALLPPPRDNLPAVTGPSRVTFPPPLRLLKLTGKPSRSQAQPVVITISDLSGDGEKIERLINSRKIKLNSSSMPIIRIRELLLIARKLGLLLTENDIKDLVKVTTDEINAFPQQFRSALSDHGKHTMQIIDSDMPGDYAWKEDETNYRWASRLIKQQPELTVDDLVLITGGNSFLLIRLWKAHKSGLSDSGKRLQNRLNSSDWNPYKRFGDETPSEWIERLGNMDEGLSGTDIMQVCDESCSVIDTRLGLRKQLSPAGKMIRDEINSPTGGAHAFRPGEDWPAWCLRLKETGISQNDSDCISGFNPDMLIRYLLQT
ncbi:hypothetical protein J2125_002999 [Erwinia toletana]|uniref:Uncharacterized protein n=1 Tax=Winslowiella toletana TaxID=92490 RepID=A0ABS4PCB0_9GAMM|nr:hypothetical protein [Winslowiella toletana]MBP2169807.1 hypothetical protein [Winslowiella toletana]